MTVPYGTAVTALVASFTTTGAGVTVGGIPQTTGVTANNFTNPVAYTVTAADGSTAVYTVTVSAGPPSPPANLRIMSDPDPPHAASPAVLAFSCEFTPGSNPISLYSWNFGDGAAASGTAAGGYDAVEHTFVTGEYTVELTVTDSAGLQAAADVVVRALPDQVLSFPPHRGVPYNPNPPVVDGEIRPEEWRGTHRITYSTGAPPADLAFQGLKHRTENFLYLAFEVKKDRAFDPDDLVVLAFRPDAAAPVPADDRRIFIHPFAAGHTPGDNQNIAGIRIWKNSTGWPAELDPAAVAAVGIEGRITSFDFAGHKAWNLELKIPTSAASPDWVNFGDDFLFYFNVCKVDSVPPPPPAPQEPTVVQLSWPRGVPDVTGDYIAHDFDAAWWGRGDKSGTAVLKGVYVESADFGTTNSPPSKILLPAADPGSADNTFFARVKNDSERETAIPPDYSEPVAAEDVRVRFRIAAWGIPGPSDWRDLPATGGLDPAAPPGIALTPAQDIPAASGGAPGEAAFSLAWRIDRPGQDYTDYAGNTHQCMLVEIDSTAGANIKLRSQYRNMNFGYASEFSQPALISARGLGPPPAGAGAHTYLIVVTPRIGAPPSPPVPKTGLIAAQDPAGNPAGQGSVEWSAHGFLYTENHAVINGNSYRILEAAGSFGHLVTHIGETVDWEYELGGAEKIGENLYIVGVPRDGTAVVTPRIRPVEFRPNGVSLHAGSATPVGTSDYGTGFTVFADWERRFTRSFMALLLAGAAWFPEKAGGDPRWNLSVNVDGRWILPRRGSFRPYLQAGPGVYLDDSGGVDAGGNIGVGAWWELTSRLHGEFGIDAHTIPSAEFNFVAAHAGIAYKF